MKADNRFYRVIIVFMLVLSLICSSCFSTALAFSSDAEDLTGQINTSLVKYRQLTLEELFGYLQNAPDADKNTMLVNDSPASVSVHTAASYPAGQVTSTNATWIQLGQTTYYDAYVENQVRNATASLILTILYAAAAGIAGVTLSICNTIILFFGNLNSTSKYFYVGRGIFYDNDFSQHYMQKC